MAQAIQDKHTAFATVKPGLVEKLKADDVDIFHGNDDGTGKKMKLDINSI